MVYTETRTTATKAMTTGPNIISGAEAPEFDSGDGAGEIKTDSGGLAMEGGECEIGCGDITWMSNLWPFLQ